MNGPAPNTPTSQCSVNLLAVEGGARPRLSPDGSMVAWATPEGVMVSPTPMQTGGTETICQLSPKLVGPGGTQPDWGVTDLVKPGNGPDPDPDPSGDDTPPAGERRGGRRPASSPPLCGRASSSAATARRTAG